GRVVAGLAAALGCVVWLTLAGGAQEHAPNPLLGNALELAAMVCSAGYMLSARSLGSRYSSFTLTAVQMAGGLVFFIPGLLRMAPLPGADPALVWPAVGMLVFLGSVVSLGAFGLYNYGLTCLPAARASAYVNLVPVVAVALGWACLGETLNPVQCLAGAGVLGGVLLTQLPARRALARRTLVRRPGGGPAAR
ncbi:MAG: DMT family transporter, partial [Desulfovibrionaceae bacterium]